MPLPAMLVPLAGFAKGMTGVGIAKTAPAMAGFMKGAAAKRFAGDALKNTGKFFLENAGKNKTEIALRLAPDIGFGLLAGATTPGDIGDKIIAGGAQMIGGGGGGIAAAGAARKLGASGNIQTLADMFGSIGGDFAGMAAGDTLLRAKGGGTTPWEKVQQQGNEQMRADLERQILATYGLAGYDQTDLLRGTYG
jgi:hypothetical protein